MLSKHFTHRNEIKNRNSHQTTMAIEYMRSSFLFATGNTAAAFRFEVESEEWDEFRSFFNVEAGDREMTLVQFCEKYLSSGAPLYGHLTATLGRVLHHLWMATRVSSASLQLHFFTYDQGPLFYYLEFAPDGLFLRLPEPTAFSHFKKDRNLECSTLRKYQSEWISKTFSRDLLEPCPDGICRFRSHLVDTDMHRLANGQTWEEMIQQLAQDPKVALLAVQSILEYINK